MARARNIKPGFFRNADLVELPYEARLLFIGLWTIADRSGRLEDRPKQIKMELFPADSIDCDVLLSMLQAIKMIERYEHDGARFIQVVNFDKHQNPHRDEKASTLPDRNGHIAEQAKAPCKHSANTLQDEKSNVPIGLIPDPLLLIPSSLNPEAKTKTRKPRPQPVGCLSVDDLVSEGVDDQVAKDWLQVRKDKGAKTLTQTAWDGVKAESIKAGLSVSDAVKVAAQNSWQGFKASWLDNSTPQSRPGFVMAEKPLSPAERQMYAASPTRCNDRVKRMMAAELGNNAPHIVDNIIEMDQGYGAPTLLG